VLESRVGLGAGGRQEAAFSKSVPDCILPKVADGNAQAGKPESTRATGFENPQARWLAEMSKC